MNGPQLDLQRVMEIVKEENPMVFELAVRRATIEVLQHENESLKNGGVDGQTSS